jgi:ankyrin repeat protein
MISVLKDNVPPLHKALVKSNLEVVKLFLERSDVDINMKSSYGFTALILAAGSIYL